MAIAWRCAQLNQADPWGNADSIRMHRYSRRRSTLGRAYNLYGDDVASYRSCARARDSFFWGVGDMAGRPQGATALGKHFYLFKSQTNQTDCLISAHGGYKKTTGTFKVKGCSVKFYVAHGSALSDPGMELMYNKNANIVSTVEDNGECMNYILSKYQGRHNKNGETYEKIHKAINFEDNCINILNHGKDDFLPEDWEASMKLTRAMSILTIRNRWFNTNQNLRDAIAAARLEMNTLVNFHCSFCRSLIGGLNVTTESVQY